MRAWTMTIAGIFGAMGVGMAAYAAHGSFGFEEEVLRQMAQQTMRQAADFQLIHALALLGVGLWAQTGRVCSKLLALAGLLFTVGVVLFCGLIYARLLFGIDNLRHLVPWGGTSMMLGWLVLAVAGVIPAKKSKHAEVKTL